MYENERIFVLPLYIYVFLDICLWSWVLMLMSDRVSQDDVFFFFKPKTEYKKFLLGFMCINHGSMAASLGHELIHKKDGLSKVIGMAVFTKMFYTVYRDSHIKNHHRKVGTPDDSSTALKDESIWRFYIRSIL